MRQKRKHTNPRMWRLAVLLAALCLLLLSPAPSNAVTFAWDANTEEGLAGYKLYRGPAPRNYDTVVDVGNVTTYEVTGLAYNQGYYFAVTAYDTEDNESDYSNEVFFYQAASGLVGSTIAYVTENCDPLGEP